MVDKLEIDSSDKSTLKQVLDNLGLLGKKVYFLHGDEGCINLLQVSYTRLIFRYLNPVLKLGILRLLNPTRLSINLSRNQSLRPTLWARRDY